MDRRFDEIRSNVNELMMEAVQSIFNKLEAEIPHNSIGECCVEFGKIYINICMELSNNCGVILEKEAFDKFMNEHLGADKRIFMRKPVKLPFKQKDVKDYGCYIYFNNLDEISPEYADSYIEMFVKEYLIKPLQNSGKTKYHYIYSYKGTIIDGPMFALHHFTKYSYKENEEILKKMQRVASKYNYSLELVPEYEIYSRSEADDILYFLIKSSED